MSWLQIWELVLGEIEKEIRPLWVMPNPEIQEGLKNLKSTGPLNLVVGKIFFNMYVF